MSEEHYESTVECLAKVWVSSNVVTSHLGINLEDFYPYARDIVKTALEQKLSTVAIDKNTEKVVAFHLSHDFRTVPNHEFRKSLDERFQAHIAFLTECMDYYRGLPDVKERKWGEAINGVVAGSYPEYWNRGVVTKTGLWAFWLAKARGYKWHFGLVTALQTQHLLGKRARFDMRLDKKFADFEYKGSRPFAGITNPPSAMIFETELDFQAQAFSYNAKKAKKRAKKRIKALEEGTTVPTAATKLAAKL